MDQEMPEETWSQYPTYVPPACDLVFTVCGSQCGTTRWTLTCMRLSMHVFVCVTGASVVAQDNGLL